MKVTDRPMMTLGKQARKPSGWLGKILFGHMAALGHRSLTKWALDFMDIQPTNECNTFKIII